MSLRPWTWLLGLAACLSPAGSSLAAETSADKLVAAALDHEVAGDAARRKELLQEARSIAPDFAPARWHLGEVRVGDEWLTVAEATKRAAASEDLREYQSLRDKAAGNAAWELDLAQWCVKRQMPDRARLHFWRVLTNPKASEKQVSSAAKSLDLVSVGGMVLTREELKQEQEREKRIARAIEKWRPILAELQPPIDAGFDEKHDKAAAKLAAIDDPAVIPAIETYLHQHQEGFGEEMIKLLTKLPQYESTQTLVRFAVVSPFLSVRERAIAELKNRPLHDYVPTLLSGLVAPIQSQFRFAIDGYGNVAYQQVFSREGSVANLATKQDVMLRPVTIRRSSGVSIKGPPGSQESLEVRRWAFEFGPELALLELATRFETQQLAANAANLAAARTNSRVYSVLEKTTDQQAAQSPNAWWNWWKNYNQVYYPKPTYWAYARSRSSYVRTFYSSHSIERYWRSCFVEGTLVWSETGLMPIESIQPGDGVLSQDPDTGELRFKVVLAKTLRPPTDASKLTVNGETITTTLGHPLWVTGKGWEMAKNVTAGDQLHGIGGIVNVNAIEPLDHKIEAHNLVVDDFNTYFVGNCGLLVHDNTYRQPTRAFLPGLIPDGAAEAHK